MRHNRLIRKRLLDELLRSLHLSLVDLPELDTLKSLLSVVAPDDVRAGALHAEEFTIFLTLAVSIV